MNKSVLIIGFFSICLLMSCKKTAQHTDASQKAAHANNTEAIFKIAFGSCASENNDLPIFYEIVKQDPDVFVFLGDNIYADTKDIEVMKQKYQKLAIKPSFQHLKKHVPIVATWDDHDYGWDDIGRHYPLKKESKEVFLDFFEEPKDSDRRKREGIYTSYQYEVGGKTIQLIVLDERTFRDDIPDYNNEVAGDDRYFYHLDHGIETSKDSTMLGTAQWLWLEKELKKPADVRIIGSGTQFGIEYNSYESWANFPHERQKMLDLIKSTNANGVVFISGDVHYAEISKLENQTTYPIYDVTASGLSATWHFATPNKNRIEGPVMENHFGLLTFIPAKNELKAEIYDITGNQRIEYDIPLNNLHN